MYIGELATRTDTPARLLRYYETQGLLISGRDTNGYRTFTETSVCVVETIRCLLAAGVPTRLIRMLLPRIDPDLPILDTPLTEEIRSELEDYRDRLRERQLLMSASLTAIEGYLEHTCPSGVRTRENLTVTRPD